MSGRNRPKKWPPGTITLEELMVRDGGICHLCRQRVESEFDAVRDHVLPWSRGGSDDASNLKLAHKACDAKRGNKLLARHKRKRA